MYRYLLDNTMNPFVVVPQILKFLMKIFCTYLILLLMLLSCSQRGKLAFEPEIFTGVSCDACPEIVIDIPKATGKDRISNAINNALREEVISQLTFDDEIEIKDIDGAIQSFSNGHKNMQELYFDENPDWAANISAEVSYEDRHMITIKVDSYLFTGGAHGYGSTQFLNFNKKKGSEMEEWELFNDRNGFRRFAENRFRKQENIPPDESINSTGYMFERGAFYLPENIGFTKEGLKLLYNQYEVASYADGPVELTLPYKEVRKYLSGKIKS